MSIFRRSKSKKKSIAEAEPDPKPEPDFEPKDVVEAVEEKAANDDDDTEALQLDELDEKSGLDEEKSILSFSRKSQSVIKRVFGLIKSKNHAMDVPKEEDLESVASEEIVDLPKRDSTTTVNFISVSKNKMPKS